MTAARLSFATLEAPVLCAVEIANALRDHPELRVRMGIHSGPVNEVTDLNEQANIAGAGINIAQRVMDCGDAGHILVSKHVAEDLEQYDQWQPYLHDLGECEIKHGERLQLVNFYNHEIGNSAMPNKLSKSDKAAAAAATQPGRSRYSTIALGIGALIVVGAAALFFASRTAFRTASGRVEPALASAAAVSEKSIAVLPFENLSRDPDNAYFTDGIQDEILTRLSKIAALKVISRTSTQKYKSAPDNLRDVGRQLGVANLLEGSVQKVANAVHVNVQLIRAANDEHLWAESYNRKLDDVFGVEGEVASAIADQLKTKLSGAEQKAVAEKPTQNAAAYDAYLHAVAIDDAVTLDTPSRPLLFMRRRCGLILNSRWHGRDFPLRAASSISTALIHRRTPVHGEGRGGSRDRASTGAGRSVARAGSLSLPCPARFPRRASIVRRSAPASAEQRFRARADGSP